MGVGINAGGFTELRGSLEHLYLVGLPVDDAAVTQNLLGL